MKKHLTMYESSCIICLRVVGSRDFINIQEEGNLEVAVVTCNIHQNYGVMFVKP